MAIYIRNEQGQFESCKVLGLKGDTGVTPNIQIGEVNTLRAGEEVEVSRTGTDENPIFNFSIPQGDSGVYVGNLTDAPESANLIIDDTDLNMFDLNLVEQEIVDGVLNLTTHRNQVVNMQNNTQITLPTVDKYTEIHLFFNTTEELTLTLPNYVAWDKLPNIIGNQFYEFIFRYVNGEWKGQSQSWLEENSPIVDGLVCWLDSEDYVIGETKWRDKSGNDNDFEVVGNLVFEKGDFFTDGSSSYVYNDTLKMINYTIIFNYSNNGAYMSTSTFQQMNNLFFIEGNNTIVTGDSESVVLDNGIETIAFVYEPNSMRSKIYVNGEIVQEINDSKVSLPAYMKFCFGKRTWEDIFHKTKINKVLIYDRPLTDYEIKHNQNYLMLKRGE